MVASSNLKTTPSFTSDISGNTLSIGYGHHKRFPSLAPCDREANNIIFRPRSPAHLRSLQNTKPAGYNVDFNVSSSLPDF